MYKKILFCAVITAVVIGVFSAGQLYGKHTATAGADERVSNQNTPYNGVEPTEGDAYTPSDGAKYYVLQDTSNLNTMPKYTAGELDELYTEEFKTTVMNTLGSLNALQDTSAFLSTQPVSTKPYWTASNDKLVGDLVFSIAADEKLYIFVINKEGTEAWTTNIYADESPFVS